MDGFVKCNRNNPIRIRSGVDAIQEFLIMRGLVGMSYLRRQ